MSAERIEAARRHLAEISKQELSKCARCGSCASVCPIYAEKNEESYCARGKLMLARDLAAGRLQASAAVRERLENCLVCMACNSNCGSNVRLDKVVLAARRLLVLAKGQNIIKLAALRGMLPSPRLMRTAMKLGQLAQPLAFTALPQTSGLRLRFALSGVIPLAADQSIPILAARPFLSRVAEHIPPPKDSTQQPSDIIYFIGCAANYLLPTIGEALVFVLGQLGLGVRIPKAQGCCGTPAAVNGETDVVRRLAQHNIRQLAGSEPVITSCGSGGLMLRHEYTEILDKEDVLLPEAQRLKARCLDISEFLVLPVYLERVGSLIRRHISRRVTYHAPCHLERGLGVTKAPRQLLVLAAKDFAEMPAAGRCCGSGGTYGFTHWEESRAIVHCKHAAAQSVQAEIIATGCPACILQIAGAVPPSQKLMVFHTIELLAWCMGYTPAIPHEAQRFTMLGS